jgi:hypothetical protein
MLERLSYRRDASMAGVMAGLLVFTFIIWNNFRNEKSLYRESRTQFMAVVVDAPGYADHADWFDQQAELAHQAAFDRAYSRGGRRSAATFDGVVYRVAALKTTADETAVAGLDEDAAYFHAILLSDPQAERLLTYR